MSGMVGTYSWNQKNNILYQLVRLVSVLTTLSIISSWIVTIGYAVYKPLAWLTTLDAAFNCLCVLFMFEFIHHHKKPDETQNNNDVNDIGISGQHENNTVNDDELQTCGEIGGTVTETSFGITITKNAR